MANSAFNVVYLLLKAVAFFCILLIPFGIAYIFYSNAAESDKKQIAFFLLLDMVPALLSLVLLLKPHEQKLRQLNKYLKDHPFIAMLLILFIPYVLGVLSKYYGHR